MCQEVTVFLAPQTPRRHAHVTWHLTRAQSNKVITDVEVEQAQALRLRRLPECQGRLRGTRSSEFGAQLAAPLGASGRAFIGQQNAAAT